MISWKNDGQDIRNYGGAYIRNDALYFRAGLTWPRRTQRGFNVRLMPAGCIFDSKGPAIFTRERNDDYLFAVLNSTMVEYLCRALMSFSSYEVGVVRKLPIPWRSS